MRSFVSDDAAQRVVFGVGTLTTVGAEIDRLFVRRVVVLSTPGHAHLADRVAELLEGRAVGRFAGAVPHTPIEVTTRAVDLVRDLGGDGVVSVGGGSTTGLGKAVASRLGVPHLVVPTTYAGSERTPVLGETSGGAKTTRSDPAILPDAVLYDVDLTATLPWSVTVTSAVNAMAHAVEALYSNQATERTDAMALDAIRSLDHGMHAVRANLDDLDGRSDLLYGAYLAGGCLGAVGMGLHHKLCHTLGGAFNLPHAPTHTVVLPYAMAYNEPAAAVAMDRIAAVMHSDHAPTAVQSLVRELGGPTALHDIGFAAVDIPVAADLAVSDSYANPREVTRTGVIELLSRALNGDPVLRTDGKTSA